jgi:hypothetical protein
MAMAECIYQTWKVRNAPSDKVILDTDALNFGPGAKIGVVDPNGAHTSSVRRAIRRPRRLGAAQTRHRVAHRNRRPSARHPQLRGCSKRLRCNRTCGSLAASMNQYRGL